MFLNKTSTSIFPTRVSKDIAQFHQINQYKLWFCPKEVSLKYNLHIISTLK